MLDHRGPAQTAGPLTNDRGGSGRGRELASLLGVRQLLADDLHHVGDDFAAGADEDHPLGDARFRSVTPVGITPPPVEEPAELASDRGIHAESFVQVGTHCTVFVADDRGPILDRYLRHTHLI